MNKDQDIEERLRRYRPAGPTPALRSKIVGGNIDGARLQPDRTVRWQLVAAVALAITALALHSATDRIDRRIASAPGPDVDQQMLDALTAEFGSDVGARLMAETMLERDRLAPVAAQEIPQ